MNNTNVETFVDDQYLLHRIKFYLLLSLQIPATFLCLLIFIFFFTHRALFRVRQNQALLILLVVLFIQLTFDLPMVVYYNYLGRISPATSGYCTWWTFLEYTLNVASEILMATISIQRHIFVFQANLFNVRLYRYLFHHIPLLFCIIYPIILYLIIVVFYPCDGTQWNFNESVCGLANCYLLYDTVLATYDWVVDNGFPIVVIAFANVALIIRVIRQKIRRQGVASWRKQRRMTLQLLSISSLYIIAWFPSIFVAIVQNFFLPTFLADVQLEYIFYLTYLVCLLAPWVCLGLFPEFINWFYNALHRPNIRHNSVRPTNN